MAKKCIFNLTYALEGFTNSCTSTTNKESVILKRCDLLSLNLGNEWKTLLSTTPQLVQKVTANKLWGQFSISRVHQRLMTRSCPCALSIGLHCFLEQPPFSSPHWQGYGLWFRQLEFLLNQSFDTLVRRGCLLFSLPLHASSGLEMNNLQKTSFNFESFNFKFLFLFFEIFVQKPNCRFANS